MARRQIFQSVVQFATVTVGNLITIGGFPTPEQAYMAVLVGLGGALAIWGASKAKVGSQ